MHPAVRTLGSVLTALAVLAVGARSASGVSPPTTPSTVTTTTSEPRKPKVEIDKGRNLEQIEYTLTGQGESATKVEQASARDPRGQKSGSSAKNSSPPAPRYAAYLPVLKLVPDGSSCIAAKKIWYESKAQAAFVNEQQDPVWLRLANDYTYCPGVARPGSPGPAWVAIEYWQESGEDLPPKPQPQIRPGWMLAGKRGYLEAGIPLRTTLTNPTRLGDLKVEATGRMYVDWGDGAREGPFDQPGAPWPNGTITHYWTTSGWYDVVVVVTWTATWRLGGESGVLEDLQTQGVIDDFEIDSLEAIRER